MILDEQTIDKLLMEYSEDLENAKREIERKNAGWNGEVFLSTLEGRGLLTMLGTVAMLLRNIHETRQAEGEKQ